MRIEENDKDIDKKIEVIETRRKRLARIRKLFKLIDIRIKELQCATSTKKQEDEDIKKY